MAKAYQQPCKELRSFHATNGFVGHDLVAYDSKGSTVVHMHMNELRLYKMADKQESIVYETPRVASNQGRYKLMQQRNLVYADRSKVLVLNTESKRVLKEVETSTFDHDGVFLQLQLIRDESQLLAQSKKQVSKLDMSKPRRIVYECRYAAPEGDLWDMHVEEEKDRVFVCFEHKNHSKIEELSLDTLRARRRIGGDLDFGRIISFHYSVSHKLLFCSEYHGSIVKVHEVQQDFAVLHNLTVINTVETNGYSPMVELAQRNLLFQGGVEGVAAIDLRSKQVIAKFKINETVKCLCLTGDGHKLLVLGKSYEVDRYVNKMYSVNLKKVEYEQLP